MNTRGYSLVEILAVFAILLSGTLLAVPVVGSAFAGARIRSAGHEALVAFVLARQEAIKSGRNTAVRFEPDARGFRMTLYRDGNGNGVRTADITKGRDRAVRTVYWDRSDVTVGILQNVRVPDPSDPSRALSRTADPVRFNDSNLCSFSSAGESTPGSLFLTDRKRRMAAVRVYNRTGKIRVLYFTAGDRRWSS